MAPNLKQISSIALELQIPVNVKTSSFVLNKPSFVSVPTQPEITSEVQINYWDWPTTTKTTIQDETESVLSLDNIVDNLIQQSNQFSTDNTETVLVSDNDDYWAESTTSNQPQHVQQESQEHYWEWNVENVEMQDEYWGWESPIYAPHVIDSSFDTAFVDNYWNWNIVTKKSESDHYFECHTENKRSNVARESTLEASYWDW